jgi:hypothetical protein
VRVGQDNLRAAPFQLTNLHRQSLLRLSPPRRRDRGVSCCKSASRTMEQARYFSE